MTLIRGQERSRGAWLPRRGFRVFAFPIVAAAALTLVATAGTFTAAALASVAAAGTCTAAALTSVATGGTFASDNHFLSRLAGWELGQRYLDRGENARAAGCFEAALARNPGDFLAAQGLCLAWMRSCRLDRALAIADSCALAARDAARGGRDTGYGARAAGLAQFVDGERLRARWNLAGAAASFRAAAAAASARGDSLSAAVASLQAARCLARSNDPTGAGQAAAMARQALAGFPDTLRLNDEMALLIADTENLEGRHARADSLYRDLLPRFRSTGRTQLECDALVGLAYTFGRRRLVQESVVHFRRAVVLAEAMGDPERLATALANLGYDETQRRELDSAREHLARARTLSEDCGFVRYSGHVLAGLGAVEEVSGDRPAAAEFFRRAIQAHREVHNGAGELGARQRLAYCLLMMGEYRQAITHYERCAALGDSIGSKTGGNWVLGGLALAYHKLGELGRAATWYQRALALNRELGDSASAAWCLKSLGLLDRMSGDFRQALLRHHEALSLFQGLHDDEGVGEAHASLAEAYCSLGDYDRARRHAIVAFEMAKAAEFDELLRSSVAVLATVCAATGEAAAAEEYLRQALDIAGRWRDRQAEAWALVDLAEHELSSGRSRQAAEHLGRAEALIGDRGEYDLRSRLLLLLARSSASPQRAVKLAHGALEAAVVGSLPEREWQALSDLGLYHRALGDTALSLEFQLQSMDVVESLRRRAGLDELRRHMLRPAILPYERALDLLVSGSPGQAALAQAFECAERSRAQILAERLRIAMAQVEAANAAPGSAAERDLVSRIGYLQARLQDASLPGGERERMRRDIEDLEREHAVLRLKAVAPGAGPAERADPARAAAAPAVAGKPAAAPPAAVPGSLRPDDPDLISVLRPGERLISYFMGTERSWLITVKGGRFAARVLPGRAVVERKVHLFLQLWRQTCAGALPAGVLGAARRDLHALLIKPIAADLVAGETLVIVPDGLLNRLPFALLGDGAGHLVDEHEIFITPSLGVLQSLRGRAAGRPPDRRLDLLAVGYSGAPADRERVLPFTGEPVEILPHAAREARRAASLFGNSLVLADGAASEGRFKLSPLDDCQILHLAAHGRADDTDMRRSFIVLGAGSSAGGEPQDGLLQWHEAAVLPLRASLVTLASCRSADGVLAVGEGITGLTQAFLYAGGTCVLAAQGDVPDRLTAAITGSFYQGLRGGLPASAALRAAQLEAVQQLDGKDGAWWAGFVLVGDGSVTARTRGPRPASPGWYVLLAAAGIAVFCVIWLTGRSHSWRRG